MKRLFIILITLLSCGVAAAQSVVIVDSEKIFKSLDDYNVALEQVDALSKQYQAEVDAKFDEVGKLFNEYAAAKSGYTAAQRQMAEAGILSMESKATKLQESYFSKDGEVMKRRLALIAPIQKRVFAAIDQYAKDNDVDLVVDRASNPSILFAGGGVDKTAAIINILNR